MTFFAKSEDGKAVRKQRRQRRQETIARTTKARMRLLFDAAAFGGALAEAGGRATTANIGRIANTPKRRQKNTPNNLFQDVGYFVGYKSSSCLSL